MHKSLDKLDWLCGTSGEVDDQALPHVYVLFFSSFTQQLSNSLLVSLAICFR